MQPSRTSDNPPVLIAGLLRSVSSDLWQDGQGAPGIRWCVNVAASRAGSFSPTSTRVGMVRVDSDSLDSKRIDGVLKTNRSYRDVAEPPQHRSPVIQGALHIREGLTVDPRWRIQHPTIFGRGRLGNVVDTRGVFRCRTSEAHVVWSHIPLNRRLTTIRLAVEVTHV
jgi:hypothetical protein